MANNKIPDEVRSQVYELEDRGEKRRVIAARLGISKASVYRILSDRKDETAGAEPKVEPKQKPVKRNIHTAYRQDRYYISRY